jgi:hypothetical protein
MMHTDIAEDNGFHEIMMDEWLRQIVRERANHRCEYCSLPQDAERFFAYRVEHIVARQHVSGPFCPLL